MTDTRRCAVPVCGLQRGTLTSVLSWTYQNTSDFLISWEELREDTNPASSHGPHHRGRVFLSLLVSGLLGLNLLDALSAIITEWAQGQGADVTWSTGWKLGNYVGQLLDCLGLRKPGGREKDVEEEGEDQRIQQAPRGAGCCGRRGKRSGGNYYERRQVKLDWH